ncbi:hypothetical protein QT711_11165 [Sporosarcina saromensis]|uniref:Phage protein n=1 Tax=Sporosarcina saromensis TaxID=359365 RepID=A0ABU4GBK4_9BACL|nr:hypothetical protein [Sporosarcina saromensis]MDW0113747.1 hypothetical protein [Sporosarcina saromensis]
MIKLNEWIYDLTASEYERKLLKESIDKLAYDNNPEYEELEELLEEVKSAIDAQDEEALLKSDLWEVDVNLEKVNEKELVVNTLRAAGYQVEESNVSSSLYAINDNGDEIRIADHKRPAIVEGNFAIHEHEEGLVIDSIEVMSDVLIANGFGKLDKGVTLYLWKS